MNVRKVIDRSAFFKELAGLTAVGMITVMPLLESCTKTNDTYSVNTSLCNGCAKCVSVCPEGAIQLSNNKASINSSNCAGCGRCARVCQQGAISS